MRTSRVVPSGLVMPAKWSFLTSAPADGATNMAIDAALLDLAPVHGAVWRCYAWDAPTVSFGRHERTADRFSAQSLADAGLPAVRRPTGGRALLHSRELTYSVALPVNEKLPWRAAYDAVNGILLQALIRLGVPARIVQHDETTALKPDGPLCFDAPATGEIVVGGKKLVGSAVWRQGASYLQHGSILLGDDQAMLTTASVRPIPAPPLAASLAECAPLAAHWPLVRDAIAATIAALVAEHTGGELSDFAPGADFQRRVTAHHAFFSDAEWLWRR